MSLKNDRGVRVSENYKLRKSSDSRLRTGSDSERKIGPGGAGGGSEQANCLAPRNLETDLVRLRKVLSKCFINKIKNIMYII